MIQLSLSGRLFESPKGYVLSREEFLAFARGAGYRGVELRYPQMPMETPAADTAQVRKRLGELGLTWVFGTVEGIHDPALYQRSLTTMKLHQAGGALFTRATAFKLEQVPLAQQFADEAAKTGGTLLMQLHAGTICDTVAHVQEAFQKIDRPNVKLAYEASHLLFADDSRYVEGIKTLAPHIAAVSLQNYKLAPANAPANLQIKIGDRQWVRAVPGDPDAVNFPAVFQALKNIGFAGWATVMCDNTPGMDPLELARQWHDYLAPLC